MITSGNDYDDVHASDLALNSAHLPVPRTPADDDQTSPTIGLITAIPEEFAAMRALLEHATERYVERDPAPYVLGFLPSREAARSHRVVLTLLGATATNAAANGCTNLVRSFPPWSR
jgi:hypothetical protein